MTDPQNASELCELAWHKLGSKLNEAHTASEAVRAVGLNWTVARKRYEGDEYRPKTGFVLVREDSPKQNREGILGSIREVDTPLQNIEAFDLFDPVIQAGAACYDSAGVFDNGNFVWMMLRLYGYMEVLPRDLVTKYLLFVHRPGNGSYRLAYVPVRLSNCSSLPEEAFHNPPPLVTTPKVRPRRFQVPVESALKEIHDHFARLLGLYKEMARIPVTPKRFEHYSAVVFDNWSRRSVKPQPFPMPVADAFDLCKHLFANGRGNELPGAEGTLWAAYNALVEFVDHYSTPRTDWHDLQEIWFSTLKASALREAAEMIKRES